MKFFVKYVTLFLLFAANSGFAADAAIYSHPELGAIRGADVVAYYSLEEGADAVLGDRNISYDYMGATWYFSNETNRALFMASPEKYLPEYGGYCAFAVSHGFTKSIQPDRWHIVDGKLYLNFNRIADFRWRKDRDEAIIRGNANWPTVLTACEEHGNCNQP